MEDKKEVIAQLQQVQSDLKEWSALHKFVEGGWKDAWGEVLDDISGEVGTLPKVPSVVDVMPVAPLPEDYCAALRAKNEKAKKRIKYCGIAAAVSVVLMMLLPGQMTSFFYAASFVSICATVAFWFMNRSTSEEFNKKDKIYRESVKKSEKSMAKFQAALEDYERECKAGEEAARMYGLNYALGLTKFYVSITTLLEERDAAEERRDELTGVVHENDVIDVSYLRYLDDIIAMLKSGRADTLKEALNIAIDEEHRAEYEAQQIAIENRRVAAAERQAEEDRRHYERMERQQREHDQAMERAEQERARIEKNRADEERRARERAATEQRHAESRARHQCSHCANYSKCSVHGQVNCGAFVPRR